MKILSEQSEIPETELVLPLPQMSLHLDNVYVRGNYCSFLFTLYFDLGVNITKFVFPFINLQIEALST